mmetsp:Transcript_24426/g.29985  ORF Transcript_24426/g.29985 Transcript_24426/m.29985 type:complete len:127 (+) Transcript_24426:5-385(+)
MTHDAIACMDIYLHSPSHRLSTSTRRIPPALPAAATLLSNQLSVGHGTACSSSPENTSILPGTAGTETSALFPIPSALLSGTQTQVGARISSSMSRYTTRLCVGYLRSPLAVAASSSTSRWASTDL